MAEERVVVRLGDIDDAIMEGINSNRELRRLLRDFVDDTKETWRVVWEASGTMTVTGEHSYQTGDYVAHIKEQKRGFVQRIFPKWSRKEPIPVGIVYNDSPHAHWIEYGTLPDKPGGHSPWGPNTPTPEFAPARRTAQIMSNKNAKGEEWA